MLVQKKDIFGDAIYSATSSIKAIKCVDQNEYTQDENNFKKISKIKIKPVDIRDLNYHLFDDSYINELTHVMIEIYKQFYRFKVETIKRLPNDDEFDYTFQHMSRLNYLNTSTQIIDNLSLKFEQEIISFFLVFHQDYSYRFFVDLNCNYDKFNFYNFDDVNFIKKAFIKNIQNDLIENYK